jgi:hypothetical protein
MSRTVRTNLGPKLLSGAIKPRPGMYGADRPRSEPVELGPMASDEAVERVKALVAGGMNAFVACRQVMREMEGQP